MQLIDLHVDLPLKDHHMSQQVYERFSIVCVFVSMRNMYVNHKPNENVCILRIGQPMRDQPLNRQVYENFFNVAHAAANVARLNFDLSSEGTYDHTVAL